MDNTSIGILLIEDNPGDTRLIREALTEGKDVAFNLECADRLSIGLDRLTRGGIDVILLDLSLPDSHGLETFVSVYGQAREVPIVVLSGLDDETLAVKAVQEGAQDYLVKGQVDGNSLVRSIRYAIERKQLETELTRLASFPEQDPNPIIETDETGAITYLNAAARAQFPSLPVVSAHHPLLHGLEAAVTALQRQEGRSLTRDIVLGDRVYEQHLSYVAAHRLVRSYVVDITERKQMEHLKDEFVTTVSHELRTPLTTFKEFTSILADELAGPTTPTQRTYLAIMKENLARLTRIVNDVLDIAKLEGGRAVLNRRFVDGRPLIDQLLTIMGPLAAGKQLRLDAKVPPHLSKMFVDPDKLMQILTNLIDNAIKFTPRAGQILIAVEELTGEIQFQVTDTGIGIGAEHLPNLFEKFQQVGRTPGGSSSKGTGLGLAICKRLVELHGGRIWATRRPGAGSTFSFTLPRYRLEDAFKDYLKTGVAQAKQWKGCFSIIVVAIAAFDELTARYDQAAIIRLLNEVERVVSTALRQQAVDIVIRWQRGELVLILANLDKSGCRTVADLAQQEIEDRAYRLGKTDERIHVLTSAATYPDDALDEEDLLHIAESRLPGADPPQRDV